MALADDYLDQAYQACGVNSLTSREKYNNLSAINKQLDIINSRARMNVKTTGTINERLVQLALEGFAPSAWYELKDKKYQWLGDFALQGYPLSVIISVKSFKAKERLLVSGTGSLHAPTIGWGRFDDPTEFSKARLEAYLFRGFLCIYMPKSTIAEMEPSAQNVKNFYGKNFIRDISNFGHDLEASLIYQRTRDDSIKLVGINNF